MEFGSFSLSAKEATMFGKTYEVRVDLADGYEIVSLDAATIDEALARASKIWPNPQQVRLLGTVDRQPQVFLAW